MANPVVESINEWEWKEVASNVSAGVIYRVVSTIPYYQTQRATGGAAPSNPAVGSLPDEAMRMFGESTKFVIDLSEASDIYVLCANSDADADDDVGKVRVDI